MEFCDLLNLALLSFVFHSQNGKILKIGESDEKVQKINNNYTHGRVLTCWELDQAHLILYLNIRKLQNKKKNCPKISDYVGIQLSYETLIVEEHVQSYVYDFTNFVSSAGGNLGLFLGFSCLSTIFGLISFAKKHHTKIIFRQDVICA